ncbi:MAG TPA: hypothetical protein PK413_01260 [Thermoanaerobaculia bacterium]|nr:hypothetical protein [Thermoanaerobaculia bacterium]
MLETLTREQFAPHLAQTFRLELQGHTLELQLAEVNALADHSGGRASRQPFSLVFVGSRNQVLPQRIYPLDHPDLGRLEIFLVPIGPDARGMRYEAVFT